MSEPQQHDETQQHDDQDGQDGQVSELAMEGTDPKEVSPEEPAVGEPADATGDPEPRYN
jgi:hypothetical protein